MIPTAGNSLANPVQGSALATLGFKPRTDYVVHSIGVQASGDEYVTRNPISMAAVTATIKSGVLTFSYPQTHPYIGIGDRVSVFNGFSTIIYLLKRKLDASNWLISDLRGESLPDEPEPYEVTKIDKSFSTIKDLKGVSSQVHATLLNSGDMVADKRQLQIACYSFTDTVDGPDAITGWTLSEEYNIRIFTPTDIRSECNSSQRHLGIKGTGYIIKDAGVPTSAISTLLDYVEIDGVSIDLDGNSVTGIEVDGVDDAVTNCLIHDGDFGIKSLASNNRQLIRGNTIHDMVTGGIEDPSGNPDIINNTIHTTAIGIATTAGSGSVRNNLVQNCSIDCITGVPTTSETNITSDATGEITNVDVIFRDSSSSDYHLDFASNLDGDSMFGGTKPTGNIAFEKDIDGNVVTGSGWHIGSHRYTPEQIFALGSPISDIKTGAVSYNSISDGIMEFDIAQTNADLTAGCLVDDGSNKFYLHERIDDTHWKVTDGNGLAPADTAGPVLITSIEPVWDNFSSALLSNGGGDTVGSIVGSFDYVSSDVQVSLAVIKDPASGAGMADHTTDRTHFLKIFSPENEGVDCNVSKRHSGVFDDALPTISVSFDFSEAGYIKIDGLQFERLSSSLGSDLSTGSDGGVAEFTNNIIKSLISNESNNGITINPSESNVEQRYIIANNIFYGLSGSGIKINRVDNNKNSIHYHIYNNTTVSCDIGININVNDSGDNGNKTFAYLYNNLMQNCVSYDYRSASGASRNIFSFGNYTSDTSIRRTLGPNDRSGVIIRFKDFENDDFRITLADASATRISMDLSSDPIFPINTDNSGIDRFLYALSAGAISWTYPEKRIANFSLGSSYSSNLDSGTTIDIVNGILTFNQESSPDIGVGDKVTYAGGVCFLAEKGNSLQWYVTDQDSGNGIGSIPDDVFGSAVTSVERVSDTLKNAIESTLISAELGSSKDLTAYSPSEIEELRIWCYNDGVADPGDVTISGWTVGSGFQNVIKIKVANDLYSESNSENRHSKTWLSSGFEIDSSTTNSITVDNDFVQISGMKIEPNDTADDAIVINAVDGCEISHMVIRNSNNGIYQPGAAPSDHPVIAGNIIHDSACGIDTVDGEVFNNTVHGSTGDGIKAGASAVLTNNISQESTGDDYSGAGIPGVLNKCISSDASAVGGTNCFTSITLVFNNEPFDDFNLSRVDWHAINNGNQSPFSTAGYHILENFPLDRAENEWSIGADYNFFAEHIDLDFSNGPSGNFRSGSSPKISIIDGVASFSEPQEEDEMGIGQKIDYDGDNKIAYLKRKISTSSWEVVDKFGNSPENANLVDLNSIENTFTDITTVLFSPDSASLSDFIGDSTNKFLNLHAFRCRITIHHYRGPDGDLSDFSMQDYICDEDNNIVLRTPFNVVTECNSRQRHDGFDDSSISELGRIYTSTLPGGPFISLNIPYMKMEGIVIGGSGLAVTALSVGSDNNILSGNIVSGFSSGIVASGNNSFINNNEVHDTTVVGIKATQYSTMVSNTVVVDSGEGIDNVSGAPVINCISQGGSLDYVGGPSADIHKCISSDTSGDIININLTFKDSGSKDFRLSSSDSEAFAIGMPMSTLRKNAFRDDISARTRSVRWDIGASEYVPNRNIKFSVGSSAFSDLATQGGTLYTTRTENGVSTITFTIPQTNDKLGAGDKIIDESNPFLNSCHLFEKINESKWIVTDTLGDPVPDRTNRSCTIIRSYSSLEDAVSPSGIWDAMGDVDLPFLKAQPTVLCYNDGVNPSEVAEIDFHFSDVKHRLIIRTPFDTEKECNLSQRHNGKVGSGYEITGSGGCIKTNGGSEYLEIDGIIAKTPVLSPGTSVIDLTTGGGAAKGAIIRNCIVYDSLTGGIKVNTEEPSVGEQEKSGVIVSNNLIFNCLGDGVSIGQDDIGTNQTRNYVSSNTIVKCWRGIYIRKTNSATSEIVDVRNNIVQDSKFQDIVVDNINVPSGNTAYRPMHNITSDGSAYNHNSSAEINNNYAYSRVKFIDKQNDDYKLSLDEDYEALDGGFDTREVDLVNIDTSLPNVDIISDIVGVLRENDKWDIGAFESTDTLSLSTELDISPVDISVSVANSSLTAPTLILHLREDPNAINDGINDDVEFGSIADLNSFLASNTVYDKFNIEIHVESGIEFTGSFEFGDKEDRFVEIKTRPSEIDNGPGSIIYDGPIVDTGSSMLALVLENLKVYSDESTVNDYLMDAPSGDGVGSLLIIDSIIQVNKDSILGSVPSSCNVGLMSSTVIFRNGDSNSVLSLAKNSSVKNLASNSLILSFFGSDLEFKTKSSLPVNDLDEVRSCLAYNYGAGNFTFGNDEDQTSGLITDENPLFEDSDITSQLFDVSDVMSQVFKISAQSPALNSGNNSFVGSELSVLDLPYTISINSDIIGNNRIFNSEVTDIGHYEISVHNILFSYEDIKQIFQDKLIINHKEEVFNSTIDDNLSYDIFGQFLTKPGEREEFSRESKIIFKLREFSRDFRLFSDKKDRVIRVFEAYYDSSFRSIIVSKIDDLLGKFLSSIFDDGRYVFFFEEAESKLTVFENNTFDKGLSGKRNIIKNVKFGGPSAI